MINDLKGIYYFGTLTKKIEKKYTKKDGTEGLVYKLNFQIMGSTHSIGSSKELNELFTEGNHYALPLGTYTNKDLEFTNLFIKNRDNDSIYQIINGELIQIN